MRADKKANIAKVAKVILNNPLLTRDEVAEKAWIWAWTASRALSELDEIGPKDERIVWLTDKDFDLMGKIQSEKFRRLQEPDKINDNDLDKWENTATKRYSLFRWDATDKDWWMKLPDVTFQIINPNADTEDTSEAI